MHVTKVHVMYTRARALQFMVQGRVLFLSELSIKLCEFNMLAPGVRQAYIDLVPALKGDRRVKNHKLAVFRLQQYNRVLQVCLCPTAIFLLALFYLIAEKIKLYNEQQTCSQFIICSDYQRDVGRRSTSNNCSLVCTSSLSLRFIKTLKHRKKFVSRESASRVVIGIQLLLLKAGDVEPNPGPMSMLYMTMEGG